MKRVWTKDPRAALLLFLVGLIPGAGQACELWRDDSGMLHGDCKLADILGDYELNYDLVAISQPRLELPNLKVKKFKYAQFGQSVEVAVEAQNLGTADTPPFDVTVNGVVINPLTLAPGGGPEGFVVQFPAMPPGAKRREFVGVMLVPDTDQDWDLFLQAHADPPIPGAPGGAVWESSEIDNSYRETCRVYGPNPDTSVPPCN
ncbi:MAG: hypothetical protein QNJ87_13110 [Gammaproteobacteria bacterium]|nr:hypothetical protein [Gammaproteobacteria bacterium]MDJ0872693.1 hypothetical protein [Gammaproteobacteria bacterium]